MQYLHKYSFALFSLISVLPFRFCPASKYSLRRNDATNSCLRHFLLYKKFSNQKCLLISGLDYVILYSVVLILQSNFSSEFRSYILFALSLIEIFREISLKNSANLFISCFHERNYTFVLLKLR
jgi:hypothetical protein